MKSFKSSCLPLVAAHATTVGRVKLTLNQTNELDAGEEGRILWATEDSVHGQPSPRRDPTV